MAGSHLETAGLASQHQTQKNLTMAGSCVSFDQVEDKANSYFQQIYNQPPQSNMPIDQVLAMLKKFKDSNQKVEKVGVPSLHLSHCGCLRVSRMVVEIREWW